MVDATNSPIDSLTGADLSSIDTSAFSIDSLASQTAPVGVNTGSTGAWTGLDSLGSTTGNVASGLLSSFGNLVSAQLNNTALLTATGRVGAPLTAAQVANANAWRQYLMIALLLAGVGVGIYVWKH
jgi:hypothetical protein